MTVGANVYATGYDYEPLKHSGLGIASFILSILIGVFDFAVFMFAGLVEMSTPGGMDEESVVAVVIGLLIIGSLFANMGGIGLGIGGIVQRNRQRIFSFLGVAFNTLIILGMLGLLIIGIMMPA